LEWQAQQEFSILPNPQDLDFGDSYFGKNRMKLLPKQGFRRFFTKLNQYVAWIV